MAVNQITGAAVCLDDLVDYCYRDADEAEPMEVAREVLEENGYDLGEIDE
jgi:hypothetical protein